MTVEAARVRCPCAIIENVGVTQHNESVRRPEVADPLAKTLTDKADRFFLALLDNDSLFYKKEIQTRIKNLCNDLDFPVRQVSNYLDLRINPPRFQGREGSKADWISRVDQGVIAFYNVVTVYPGYSGYSGYFVPTVPNAATRALGIVNADATHNRSTENLLFMGPRVETLSKKGTICFDVTWSVHVDQKTSEFSEPQIISVEHVETTWE